MEIKVNKKTSVMVCLIIVLFWISGCSVSEFPKDVVSQVQEEEISEIMPIAETILRDTSRLYAQGETPGNSPEAEQAQVPTSFLCDEFSAQVAPVLTIYPDGTFVFLVNLGECMGTMTGNYELHQSQIVLQIEEKDFSNFAGEDLQTASLEVVDNYTLIYTGEPVGLIYSGMLFIRL